MHLAKSGLPKFRQAILISCQVQKPSSFKNNGNVVTNQIVDHERNIHSNKLSCRKLSTGNVNFNDSHNDGKYQDLMSRVKFVDTNYKLFKYHNLLYRRFLSVYRKNRSRREKENQT